MKNINSPEFKLIDDFSIDNIGDNIFVEVFKNADGQFLTLYAHESQERTVIFHENWDMLQSVLSDDVDKETLVGWK